jgi:hypothetical protein
MQIGARRVEPRFDAKWSAGVSGGFEALFEFGANVEIHDASLEDGELLSDRGK